MWNGKITKPIFHNGKIIIFLSSCRKEDEESIRGEIRELESSWKNCNLNLHFYLIQALVAARNFLFLAISITVLPEPRDVCHDLIASQKDLYSKVWEPMIPGSL
jgi:hypothetical protein